jgi:hypothetical protein
MLYLMYKGCPIHKAPLDIKTKQEVITMLNVAHLFQWSIIIIFNIPKYIEALVPPQQQYKIQSW